MIFEQQTFKETIARKGERLKKTKGHKKWIKSPG